MYLITALPNSCYLGYHIYWQEYRVNFISLGVFSYVYSRKEETGKH
jgi:hypothetical protein